MATTATLTGTFSLPNDAAPDSAVLSVTLSAMDTDQNTRHVLPDDGSFTVALVSGAIPAGQEIWKNTAGLRGTHYRATLAWTASDGRLLSRYLGSFQVGDDASYDMADLLDQPPIATLPEGWYSTLTQGDYDAAITARDQAVAAAALSAAYAQTPEDTTVPGGSGYSALHYAAKAGADALATAADRVQTGLDAAAAEADRLLAETARDEAQGYAGDAAYESGYFDTIALGRAAVADGASFGVIAGGSDGLLYPAIYRRDSSSTQTLIREVITRAEVTRINSELGRSRAIIDAPPVTLTDGRLIYPDVMTFDLRVISGVDANGLPWHYLNVSDVDLPDRVTVGARTVVVTEWSFDLRPLRGYYDDTGAPWPEDAGADGTVYPDLEVDVVSATLLRIYVRQWGATYVRWHLQRDTVPEKNADVWRIGTASEVTRSSDGTYTYVADICFDGETEMAILLRQSIGGSLKPDHIGGKTHGNEELVAVSVLLDGVEIGADAGLREVRSVELVQSSILYEPGDTEGTVWSPKGAEISRHYKHLYIGPDGWWKQRSRVEWGTAENFSVSNGYFGMLCLNAPPIITTSKRAPYWALEDVSGTFTSVHDTSDHVKAWGARYGGEVRIVSGWTAAGRNIEVDSRSDRRKIYPDFFDGELTVIDGVGAIWNVEVHYRTTIKESF